MSTPKLIRFGDLETVTVDTGIDDLYWGPAPAVPEPKSDEQEVDDFGPDSDYEADAEEVAELLDLFAADEALEADDSAAVRANRRRS